MTKTAILFYSYSGKTKLWAETAADALEAELYEIKEAKHRSKLNTFLVGCMQARKQTITPLATLPVDLDDYDRIVLAAPIWAGYPAPAFNGMVEMLPPDKQVELAFTSASGKSSCREKVEYQILDKECTIADYLDVCTGK